MTGEVHEHRKEIIEENEKTTVIDRDIITDKDGNVIRQETDIVEIAQDEEGNTYRHEHDEISEENRVTIIDQDIVHDSSGHEVSRETDIRVIDSGSNKSNEANDGKVHKHETDVIEIEGKTTIIEKDIVEDEDHNVIHRETKVTQITKLENGEYEVQEDRDVEDIVDVEEGNNAV